MRFTPTVTLLALAVFLNYFDRGNLATASPLMQSELHLTPLQMGVLFSAFFWSYAPLQPLAGWFAQRFAVRYVLAVGLSVWAVATALTGWAHGFAWLLACRVLLGVGESVNYPCNAQFLATHVAIGERSRANGLIAVGQALGPTAGSLLGGLLIAGMSWRVSFIVFGAASLLWLVPWLGVTRRGSPGPWRSTTDPVGYSLLLKQRTLWATSLGHFCGNYAFYFMLTWLPLLLVRQYGFSVSQMALIAAGVYGLQACAALASGVVCDALIRRGVEAGKVWTRMMVVALCSVALAMAGCVGVGAHGVLWWLALAGICFGVQSAPLGALTQTLAGPRAAGQWMGVQNLCANMAGVSAPVITGWVVHDTGHFAWAFGVAAGVTLLGALCYLCLLGPIVTMDWRNDPGKKKPPRDAMA